MRKYKKLLIVLICLMILGLTATFGLDLYVKMSTETQILSVEDIAKYEFDSILILGAGIRDDGTPSPMLQERLDKGIELYKNGVSNKIIMSGDHGRENHDEVNAMKEYAADKGIPPEDIFMDHAGFSTYDSIYRAKEIFQTKRIAIVTQKYHLYRAIYIANSLGLESYGVDAEVVKYSGNLYRELREILARDKDAIKCLFKPSSTYEGDTISVFQDGNITNDKEYVIIKKIYEDEKGGEFKFHKYISRKTDVDLLKSIISNYEFKKETCDCIPNYIMDWSDDSSYSMVVSISPPKVFITKNENGKSEEIKLDDEDSKKIVDLLEN